MEVVFKPVFFRYLAPIRAPTAIGINAELYINDKKKFLITIS